MKLVRYRIISTYADQIGLGLLLNLIEIQKKSSTKYQFDQNNYRSTMSSEEYQTTFVAKDPDIDIIAAFGPDGFRMHLSGTSAVLAMAAAVVIVAVVTHCLYLCIFKSLDRCLTEATRDIERGEAERRQRSRSPRSSSRRRSSRRRRSRSWTHGLIESIVEWNAWAKDNLTARKRFISWIWIFENRWINMQSY